MRTSRVFFTHFKVACASVMLFVLCTLALPSYAALPAGTYTIDPSGSATATNYLTLTSAISDMTSGTRADGGTVNGPGISGAVIFELASGYTSASEAFPLTFTSITGASAASTVTVRPAAAVAVASALTITAASLPGTVVFSGARYVYIDGRPGGTGTSQYLTIANTNTSSSAIGYLSDAVYNTVSYCTVTGVATSATVGIVNFGTGASTGNSYNKITNCDIRDGATTPATGIYSLGSAGVPNTNDTIANCNIYNFFAIATTYGINIDSYNSAWYVNGDHLYQTANRTTNNSSMYMIYISNSDGHIISNNVVGYANAAGTGTFTLTSAGSTSVLFGIYSAAGSGNTLSVQGNNIGGITLSTGYFGLAMAGIYITSGNANIGNITGNNIGSTTSTGSLTLHAASGASLAGIYCNSSNIGNIQNNTISGLSNIPYSPTYASNTYGIYWGNGAYSFTCSNNTVGSSTANSIADGDPLGTTTGKSIVIGIGVSTVPYICVISNNTVQNMGSFGPLYQCFTGNNDICFWSY